MVMQDIFSLKNHFTEDDKTEQQSNASNGEQIISIKLSELLPFPNQPFRPYSDEKLWELAADIKQNGVLSPIIVRPFGNAYQILAGHNRVNASKLAGLNEIPSIVKDVDDDAAKLILVNTNINQRDKLLPSEKAFAYKMQLDAMNRQGKRTDLTSCQVGTKLAGSRSDVRLSECSTDSARTIQRYIRLTELIPELLEMVDNESLAFMVGVYLSYLSQEKQQLLYEYMDANELKKVSLAQAEVIKSYKEALDDNRLKLIFFGLKEEKKKATTTYKLPTDRITSYFPDLEKSEIEQELIKILDEYFKRGG
ncbi:ParB/RepB/Spo0J family partition protein [Hydrogenoanaerobacterium saccharovorans]|nr:ParB/RepB/Spo0J family partition protein [Hydrogenoanaerobacterium saccharovorans]